MGGFTAVTKQDTKALFFHFWKSVPAYPSHNPFSVAISANHLPAILLGIGLCKSCNDEPYDLLSK